MQNSVNEYIEILSQDSILISIDTPDYDGETFETVEFSKDIKKGNLYFDIKGKITFKFDDSEDEIFGRECNIQDFEITEIKAFDELSNCYEVPFSYFPEIKKIIQISNGIF